MNLYISAPSDVVAPSFYNKVYNTPLNMSSVFLENHQKIITKNTGVFLCASDRLSRFSVQRYTKNICFPALRAGKQEKQHKFLSPRPKGGKTKQKKALYYFCGRQYQRSLVSRKSFSAVRVLRLSRSRRRPAAARSACRSAQSARSISVVSFSSVNPSGET